jgi:hypothetical protein|nr:MAG TPA: head closure knob [Caudoviricetes sp.]
MNYKNRVTLYHRFESRYNPITKRKEIDKNEIEITPCNINCLTAENARIEFGEIARDINIIRIPKSIIYSPTHASLDGKEYKVVKIKFYQHSTSLYVKEVVK